MIKVTENFRKIQDLLRAEAVAAGRRPEEVQLLAVSKQKPLALVLEAAAAGQRHFGENFAKEGIDKLQAAGRDDLVWHFIGHLQSNKTRQVASFFDWVHTVDRLKIARRLSDQRPQHAGELNVCLQVNVDDEDSKSGLPPADVLPLARAVVELPRLRLRGLMCIPAPTDDPEQQRRPFAQVKKLLDELKEDGIDADTLSMGMTNDYAAAIREGATLVRIGTALFGARDDNT